MIGILLQGSDWNMAIEQQAQESIYYSTPRLDLITGLYGYSLVPPVAADANGRVIGFLSLCSVSSSLRGRRLIALPIADQCHLLAADSASADSLRRRDSLDSTATGAIYRAPPGQL
jgi:hypothetical protein